MRQCRNLGIVHNNFHPKNVRVIGDRLMLIDIGSDVVPWSAGGFTAMCRRAFLSWRWWNRRDLNTLLTRSLTEPDLPELSGVQHFHRALEQGDALVQLRRYITDQVLAHKARNVLDYGCGTGRLVHDVSVAGVHVVGFDPDPALVPKWHHGVEASTRPVVFGGRELLNTLIHTQQRFDVVISSLVLCILDDGPDYEEVLTNLRRFVHHNGTVFVAVCNPFATFGGNTPFKSRALPSGVTYDDMFRWSGTAGITHSTREDVHRPLHRLERDLLRHGLRVQSRWMSDTIDLDRFEPASDFMVLTLVPTNSLSGHHDQVNPYPTLARTQTKRTFRGGPARA